MPAVVGKRKLKHQEHESTGHLVQCLLWLHTHVSYELSIYRAYAHLRVLLVRNCAPLLVCKRYLQLFWPECAA